MPAWGHEKERDSKQQLFSHRHDAAERFLHKRLIQRLTVQRQPLFKKATGRFGGKRWILETKDSTTCCSV